MNNYRMMINMTSALVNLTNQYGLFNLKTEDRVYAGGKKGDKMCMTMRHGKIESLKDGSIITDDTLQANQSVLIYPAAFDMFSRHYHIIVSYNKELVKSGAVVTPICPLVPPGEKGSIGLLVRTTKKINLIDIGHVFELYQID